MKAELTQPELITKDSYDNQAEAWNADHRTQRFWGENFDTFHRLLPQGRLLEIGCGSGRDAQELIRMGYEYYGIDISSNLLTHARKTNPGARFEKVSLYDLDFEEPFDGFWCAAVLIHVPKERINEALQAINRSVKAQAIGFLAVKEGEGERLEKREELNNAKFLFAYWHNDEFKNVLSENGFKVVGEGYMPMSERTKWLTHHVQKV